MKILIDENKYLTCFCVDAELNGGIEVDAPEDVDAFADVFRAYRYENGALILDVEKLQILNDEHVADVLRHRREKACFQYINRGYLWYSKLTEEQKAELETWYQAWLDVTETKFVPTAPEWLV